MSQLREYNVEIRTLWPNDLAMGIAHDGVAFPDAPSDQEDIGDWIFVAYVDPKDPSLGRDLYYRHTDDADRRAVSVLLYGTVKGCSLEPLGNWSMLPHGAHLASRWIEIDDGGCPNAFQAQIRALRKIDEYVAYVLRGEPMSRSCDSLYLKQRLFTKNTPGKPRPVRKLQDTDDPDGLTRLIEDEWTATCDVDIWRLTADGEVKSSDGFAIKKGDFVEVMASFIVTIRRARRNLPQFVLCPLKLERVTKLWGAVEYQAKKTEGLNMNVEMA